MEVGLGVVEAKVDHFVLFVLAGLIVQGILDLDVIQVQVGEEGVLGQDSRNVCQIFGWGRLRDWPILDILF